MVQNYPNELVSQKGVFANPKNLFRGMGLAEGLKVYGKSGTLAPDKAG